MKRDYTGLNLTFNDIRWSRWIVGLGFDLVGDYGQAGKYW